jgi:hypothetical protein
MTPALRVSVLERAQHRDLLQLPIRLRAHCLTARGLVDSITVVAPCSTTASTLARPSSTITVGKFSRADPGARFTAFDFSYRLPYFRKYVTIYTDPAAHDNVFSVSAPGRAGFHPGVYPAQIPGARKFDLRAEAAVIDVPDINSIGGRFLYWESVQVQGYTNKGFLIGDQIGREGKGG